MDDARPNPWLSIPAGDYEGHMASPNVRQLQHLSRVFGELLREFDPQSVAVIGAGAGNGLEHVDPRRVKRVVGVDINPSYLDLARSRHGARLPGLELVCADAASCELPEASFDLVYAALIFEYVDPAVLAGKIAGWLGPRGAAAALLQLPSPCGRVSETPYLSVRLLEPFIHLVEPSTLRALFAARGLREIRSGTETLEGGKGFYLGVFRRADAGGRATRDTVERIHDDVDGEVRRLAGAHGGRIRCGPGCSSCCVDGITVFPIEAERIRLRHGALLAGGEPHPPGACAFLDGEGRCRVYEDRPYVCRTQGLPLRWTEDGGVGEIELRDICPLNDEGTPVEDLASGDCWTIGPFEERLALAEIARGGGRDRVPLRALFENPARRAGGDDETNR